MRSPESSTSVRTTGLLRQAGFSLVEIMVVAGIASIIMLGIADMFAQMGKNSSTRT